MSHPPKQGTFGVYAIFIGNDFNLRPHLVVQYAIDELRLSTRPLCYVHTIYKCPFLYVINATTLCETAAITS